MDGDETTSRLGGHGGTVLEVYKHFAALIDSGKLEPGDQLPTYPEIEQQHATSHATVAKAISLLRKSLYVRSTTRGIFVHLSGNDRLLQQLADVLNALEESGQQIQLESSAGVCCIAGRSGGVCWNPEKQMWEKDTH